MFFKCKSILAFGLLAACLAPTSSLGVKNGSAKNGAGRNAAGNFGPAKGAIAKRDSKIISFEQAIKMTPEKNNDDRITLRNLQLNGEAKVKNSGETVYLRNYRAAIDGRKANWMGLTSVASSSLVFIEVSADRYIDVPRDLIPIDELTLP